MNRLNPFAPVILGLLTLFPGKLAAQEPHHPQLSIAHKGIQQLKDDIKLMLDLATDEERHWENWDGVIELFAFGMDYDRSVRVDVLTGLIPAPVMIFGAYTEPVDDLLHENLEGAEYVPKKISDTLYELLPPDRGWFRILPAQKYAILTLSEQSNHSLLKQLILKADNPLPVIERILKDGANVGVELSNEATTPDDQEKRKSSFAEIRANQMDALQKRPTESTTEFELRKGILSVNQDELERLIVESAVADAHAFLLAAGPTAEIKFSATAIEGTGFEKALKLFKPQPDAFASVKKAEGSALSIRINHPIDELRQSNADRIMDLIKADVSSRVNADDSNMSPEAKDATTQLVDGIMQLIKDGNASGNLNAFVESVPNDEGRFVSWGAVVLENAKRLDETLALLSKTGENNKADIAIETVRDVAIHRVTLKAGFLKIFDDLFGEDAEVYIGTSDNMVWFGAGPDSLGSLKTAIEALGDPAESDLVLNIDAEMLPWAQRAETVTKGLDEPESVDDKQARRDLLLTLKQATEALKESDDDVKFSMDVKDGKAAGVIKANTGILRFIGTQLEKFSKENLE